MPSLIKNKPEQSMLDRKIKNLAPRRTRTASTPLKIAKPTPGVVPRIGNAKKGTVKGDNFPSTMPREFAFDLLV
jgi:hypothetical protein